MLNLRDVTSEHRHDQMLKSSRVLKALDATLSGDFSASFKSVELICKTLLRQNIELTRKQLCLNYRAILVATKFTQIKVRNLSDINKLTSNSFKMKITPPFSVKTMAHDVIEIVNEAAVKKEIRIMLSLEGKNTLSVRSDRNRIEQVLLNLLNNSIETSPIGGTIKVSFTIESFCTNISDKTSF